MITSPARQTFRETVALVAEKARARLPQAVNGRIESAVKLVLLHDVMPQEDGSILVGSSRDPLTSYLLVGTACECQDFVHGKAPGGWCQHRLAAGIHKRVQELLPQEPEPVVPDILEPWPDNDVEGEGSPETTPPEPPAAQPAPLPEAPASVNVRLVIDGRDCQLTLRDRDEGRLLARLQAVLAQYSMPQPAPQAASQGEGWCPKHGLQMTQTTKDGRSWWSHRTPEGQWCKGK